MKGIIVVDIPEACVDCEFCREIDEGIEACCTLKIDEKDDTSFRQIDDYCQDKPDWCPIKPMPEKKNVPKKVCSIPGVHYVGWANGWNCCVDKILKGESHED